MALTRIPDPVNKQPSAVNPQPPSVNAQPSNAGLTREPDVAAGGGPAVPTLSAPAANANIFNGVAVTLTATTTDVNLDKMDFVLDPSGSNTVVATVVGAGTPAGTFSTTWTPSAVSDAAHTLVARATRAAQSTDSATTTVNVGEVLHTLISSVTVLRAWQADFGVTLGGTLLASGTTPPVVTLSGSATAVGLYVQIDGAGTLGVATFKVSSNGGSTFFATGILTAASVALTDDQTGRNVLFPAGTYATDNVYQGTVSSWVDQKSGTSAAQATAANQPRAYAGLYGTHPGVRGDGANDSLFESTLNLPAPATTNTFVYAVVRAYTWTNTDGFWGSGIGTTQVQQSGVSPQMKQWNTSFSGANGGPVLGSAMRMWAHFTGSTADTLKIAATSVTGASTGNADPAAGFRLLAVVTAATDAIDGDAYCYIICNGKPSAGELTALDAAVAAMIPGVLV